MRVSALKVFMNVLLKSPSDYLHTIMITALVATSGDIKNSNYDVDKKKFYKLLTTYLKSRSCPDYGASPIITNLLKTSIDDPNFEIVLSSLNAIGDADPGIFPVLSDWAMSILQSADFTQKSPPLPLVQLFLAPIEMSEEKKRILFEKVLDYVDEFTVYRIARTAFRYGHWKMIAGPLLELISERVYFLLLTRDGFNFF